ncbi:hypothetical protein AFL01nite_21850 [Aeromicrobium flavum]|uniref:Uncharacterized protein n=1 Tax=Aeromicrobium flavum TaxID=416568 RepID=A0A512HWN4_9ACTN|nr:hypothetical protein [Aeromicrobium flavum]GEO89858.1 hypothetical protein AFL01nite_21850 [Aeromicrobium flavum]
MTTEPTADAAGRPDPSSIDEAVAMLDRLGELEVAQHPQVFEAVHRVLRDQLAGPAGTRG